MPCFFPIQAYKTADKQIVFQERGNIVQFLKLPCGQCIGCRLERSRQWAVRCVHEAKTWKQNSFITLTFNDVNVPQDYSLNVRHLQLFMKKFRKKYKGISSIEKDGNLINPIRFYAAGEYGSMCAFCRRSRQLCRCDEYVPSVGRPHYHLCIFNFDFDDKKIHTVRNGFPIYRSAKLEELWPYGFSSIAELNFQTAAYVARYVMKKINGDLQEDHYALPNWETGEITPRKPEFNVMSRMPGIGSFFYEKYKDNIFPLDRVVMNGKPMRPPKAYEKWLGIESPEELEFIKTAREKTFKNNQNALDNSTPERLKVIHEVKKLQLQRLIRPLGD